MQLIDQNVLNFLVNIRAEWLTSVALIITYLGGHLVIIIISLLSIAHFYFKKHLEKILPLIVAVGGSATTVYLLKHILFKARPIAEAIYFETGSSFPSGHATMSMALYGFLFYTILKAKWHPLKKLFLIVFPLLIILIGLSRIYLGVHYLSDVLCGFVIGAVWILLALAVPKSKTSLLPDNGRHV